MFLRNISFYIKVAEGIGEGKLVVLLFIPVSAGAGYIVLKPLIRELRLHKTLITLRLGGVMVQHPCSNGHTICKDLGSSPTYGQ